LEGKVQKTKSTLKSDLKSNATNSQEYLMESEEEVIRLEIKTDPVALRRQALWCGIKPGMRVLDVGCGSGKTTALLHEMIQPGGSIAGVDYSVKRIEYAKKNYGGKAGLTYQLQDLRESMEEIGQFDLVWVRFVLEYYRKEAPAIVSNLKKCLKPGGILSLLDLDYNCLNHYGLPPKIDEILPKIMDVLDEEYNFDTFVGRKLYSYLYDSGFENIELNLEAHHLIYGQAKEKDIFNWIKKIEMVPEKVKDIINEYQGGYDAFLIDFKKYFLDPRRFIYTPLLLCKGTRPLSN
jgi:SAM-dependent methyltransferase